MFKLRIATTLMLYRNLDPFVKRNAMYLLLPFKSHYSSKIQWIEFPLLINLFLQHERTNVKHSLIADPEGSTN